MAQPDRTDKILDDAGQFWRGLVRFCLGMMSLAAAICLGFGAYACVIGRDIARAFGGRGDKAEILGVSLPYSIMMTLLVGLCVLSAFAAVYTFFFPTQSSMENSIMPGP